MFEDLEAGSIEAMGIGGRYLLACDKTSQLMIVDLKSGQFEELKEGNCLFGKGWDNDRDFEDPLEYDNMPGGLMDSDRFAGLNDRVFSLFDDCRITRIIFGIKWSGDGRFAAISRDDGKVVVILVSNYLSGKMVGNVEF